MDDRASVETPLVSRCSFSTFSAEIDRWYSSPDFAPATRGAMARVLTLFGGLPGVETTADLTPSNVAAFKLACAAKSPNTTYGLLSYLRTACGWAVEWGHLDKTPFRAGVKLFRKSKVSKKRHQPAAAIQIVLDSLAREAVGDWQAARLHALFAVAAFSGARRNEILFSQVGDYDLTRGVWSIVPRHRLKTVASEAEVPIVDELRAVLSVWFPRARSVWAFPTLNRRRPWTGGSPGSKPLDCLRAAGAAAGVADLTFLSLRHSWATMAATRWGLTEKQIQAVLRHTTGRTQVHYCHPEADELRARMSGISFGPTAPNAPDGKARPTEIADLIDQVAKLRAEIAALTGRLAGPTP